MASCSSDKPSYLEPHLSTLAATDITRNEATLNGIAEIEGDADMPQLYFRYGTTENMDQTVPITTESEKISKQSSVSVRLKNLIASNTYYYMLQGSNGRTITSGNMMNFTTLPNEKPKVGNTTLLSHGPTSAFVSYDILEDGGENITETGCYYELASQSATETQSEKENMEKEIPGKNATKEILTNYSGGLGQQKLLIGKLTLNTTYKIWPYAKSRMGETIGDCITYTTTSDAIMLKEAGELQSLLSNNLYDYTSLTLAGPMNGDDLNCLRKMMGRNLDESDTPGKLASIDMTDVKIVAGGGPYGTFCQLRLSHKSYPTYRCHNHRKGCLYELQVTRQDRNTCFGKQSAAIQRLYGAERHRCFRSQLQLQQRQWSVTQCTTNQHLMVSNGQARRIFLAKHHHFYR